MIAVANNNHANVPAWHKDFLIMLPKICRDAQIAFCSLPPEAREESVQEVICNALVAFRRLVELNKEDIAYATPLAQYAIRQIRSGRRVGTKLNVRDISSRYCQQSKRITVERLDRFDSKRNGWREVVVEDRQSGPDVVAATRIDFDAWLKSLRPRMRQIATTLATGESTSTVAHTFNISRGRVSQLRRELMHAWYDFQGEMAMV